jgi:hypothetical protein
MATTGHREEHHKDSKRSEQDDDPDAARRSHVNPCIHQDTQDEPSRQQDRMQREGSQASHGIIESGMGGAIIARCAGGAVSC